MSENFVVLAVVSSLVSVHISTTYIPLLKIPPFNWAVNYSACSAIVFFQNQFTQAGHQFHNLTGKCNGRSYEESTNSCFVKKKSVICLPTKHVGVLMHSRSNWNLEVLVLEERG